MSGRPISIVIADDHTIVRQGLMKLMEEEPGMEVIGEAVDGRDAVKTGDGALLACFARTVNFRPETLRRNAEMSIE